MARKWFLAGLVALLLAAAPGLFSWHYRFAIRTALFGLPDDVVRLPPPGELVVLVESPRLTGELRSGPPGAPMIVVVHGSQQAARNAVFPRLLAGALHRRGNSVLAIDLRGFGDSGRLESPLREPPRFAEDVADAARAAVARGWASPKSLAYVGHSLGGFAVLGAARLDPRPAGIITIGAPVMHRINENGVRSSKIHTPGRIRDLYLEDDPVTREVMERYLDQNDAGRLVQVPGLPPVLMVYGSLDDPSPRVLKATVDAGHEALLVPGANHYFNVRRVSDDLALLESEHFEALADTISAWVALRTDGDQR